MLHLYAMVSVQGNTRGTFVLTTTTGRRKTTGRGRIRAEGAGTQAVAMRRAAHGAGADRAARAERTVAVAADPTAPAAAMTETGARAGAALTVAAAIAPRHLTVDEVGAQYQQTNT